MREPSVLPTFSPWWLEEALAAEKGPDQSPPLEGDGRADVAVVGAGYTGLWAALALRERAPSLAVTVLEAKAVAWGPSGRNGGFLDGYWTRLALLRDVFGADRALAVARAAAGCIPAVRRLATERAEDVWLREGGVVKVSAASAQDAAIDRAVDAAAALGVPEQAVPLSRDDVVARCRSPRFRRGVLFPEGATVQPARLARALRRATLAAGVVLHERTPVVRLVAGRPNLLETPRGRLRADAVVVAAGPALAGWRPASARLTTFGSYVVLTEPVPDLLEDLGWTGGEAITDGRTFVHYFRATADGRVLMGSGSGPIGLGGRVDARFFCDRRSGARAEAGLRLLLPDLAGRPIERAWGGPVDVSVDRLPFVATVPGTRIHFGAGYSGHGVGPSWLAGQVLASLALERDDEWVRLPLVRMPAKRLPPEPLRRLAGGVIRAAALAAEDAEERGERPSRSAAAVAAVPRLLGLPLGTR